MYTQRMLNPKVLTIARIWIPLAITSTILCALLYLAVQQHIRQSANDPQIQLAQDRAALLSQNKTLQEVVPSTPVDMRKSLSPFLIVFNDQGQVIASSGQLDGKTPTPPPGIFEYVKTHGEDRITWEPQERVRIAAVVTSFKGDKSGFILAGRSLREVEKRTYQLSIEVLGAWVAALILSLFAVTLLSFPSSKK